MRLILISLLGLLLCCCSKPDNSQSLDQAELDLMNGNIENVRATCRQLIDSANVQITPSQLCRIAILYARIAEQTDNQEDMAAAAQCYNRACELNVDSVESYLASLSVEDQSHARLLRDISNALAQPEISLDNIDDSYPDSLKDISNEPK